MLRYSIFVLCCLFNYFSPQVFQISSYGLCDLLAFPSVLNFIPPINLCQTNDSASDIYPNCCLVRALLQNPITVPIVAVSILFLTYCSFCTLYGCFSFHRVLSMVIICFSCFFSDVYFLISFFITKSIRIKFWFLVHKTKREQTKALDALLSIKAELFHSNL